MQPVGTKFPETSSVQPKEAKTEGVIVIETAESKQLRVNDYTKEVLDPVLQVVVNIVKDVAVLLLVPAEKIKELSEYKAKVSLEELALYNHFSRMLLVQCSQILSILPDALKPAFGALIQEPLQQKMPEAVQKIREISPEFLENVQLAECSYKIDQLMSSLKDAPHEKLIQLKEGIEKGEAIEDSAFSVFKELSEYKTLVSPSIGEVVSKYIIQKIETLTK